MVPSLLLGNPLVRLHSAQLSPWHTHMMLADTPPPQTPHSPVFHPFGPRRYAAGWRLAPLMAGCPRFPRDVTQRARWDFFRRLAETEVAAPIRG